MSFNGSGTYNLPAGQPVVTGTVISSPTFNTLTSDLATALTNTVCKDGQSTPSANLPMGGFKLTGLGAASASTDSARLSTVQNSQGQLLGTIAGTNTITAQATPTLTAYASGQTFRFPPAGTNTGATTINIDSLGAKNIFYNGSALGGGEIPASGMVTITYDGTQFNLTASAAAGSSPFSDATAIVKNSVDATKLIKLSAASVTTGTTRTYTGPDANGTIVLGTAYTNATLTLATARLLGRTTASSGAAEEITVSPSSALSGGVLTVGGITLGTPTASTSGTSIDYTSIASTVKRITGFLSGVSTNGTSELCIEIGDSGGIETTGYLSAATNGAGTCTTSTASFLLCNNPAAAAVTYSGMFILQNSNSSTFQWNEMGNLSRSDGFVNTSGGRKATSAALDRVRFTTALHTDTFDAGEVNIATE